MLASGLRSINKQVSVSTMSEAGADTSILKKSEARNVSNSCNNNDDDDRHSSRKATVIQRLKWIAGILCFIGLAVALSQSPQAKQKAKEFTEYAREHPMRGGLYYTLFAACITVSGIPFRVHDVVIAYTYPYYIAVVMVFTARTIGSTLCFLVAGRLLSENRKAEILSNETVKKINKLIAKSPIYYGTILRLATVPTFVKNYGLALLDVNLTQYVICCAVGSGIFIPLQVYTSKTFAPMTLGLVVEGEEEKDLTGPFITSVVGMCSLVFCLRTFVKTVLSKADDDDADAAEDKSKVPVDEGNRSGDGTEQKKNK